MNKKGELYCVGCGLKLQYEHEEKEGYVARKKYLQGGEILCKRCFDIRFHNRVSEVEKINIDYRNLINNIAASKSLIVYVADIFNFDPESINKMLANFNNKIIFVINKVDIIPQAVKKEKIASWVKSQVKHPSIVKILTTSSKINFHMDELISAIDEYREGKDVYFIGSTNAGKSSIINAFLKNYINPTSKQITTSCYANTTLQIVEIPLDRKSYIFDTPGFIEEDNISRNVEPQIIKKIMPLKEIKPQVYQIRTNQSFYIGGLLRIDIEPEKRASIIVYGSSNIKISRSKLEKADNVFENLIINKQIEPVSKRIEHLRDFEDLELVISKDKEDLFLPGYCFITLRNLKGTTIKLKIIKNTKVFLQDSLI